MAGGLASTVITVVAAFIIATWATGETGEEGGWEYGVVVALVLGIEYLWCFFGTTWVLRRWLPQSPA